MSPPAASVPDSPQTLLRSRRGFVPSGSSNKPQCSVFKRENSPEHERSSPAAHQFPSLGAGSVLCPGSSLSPDSTLYHRSSPSETQTHENISVLSANNCHMPLWPQQRNGPCGGTHSPSSACRHVGAALSMSEELFVPMLPPPCRGCHSLAFWRDLANPFRHPGAGLALAGWGCRASFMGRALLDCRGFAVWPSFSPLNSKTIPQMSFCLISVLMNISGYTTSPPAVTPEPQAMLSRCRLCAVSLGC